MKKIFVTLLLLTAGALVLVQAQKIKGSDTVLPLSQKAAENYLKHHPTQNISITGGGSGVGLSALLEGTTDIAQSSRKIKFDEKQKLQAAGKTAREVIIAYDALAIIVHPSNPITRLTREQLEGIFTGKIKNWKELGGDNRKIIPYARETSSGTFEFFRESVLKNKNYLNGIMSLPATGAIIQSIGQTPGAIGYVGLAYLSKEVRALHVSYDQGKTFTAPSIENAKNATYPLVRQLYYYYESSTESTVQPFVDYLLSPAGQNTVRETGFITVN
jgi:phosphate transport system substrate-binding protein